MRTESTTPLQDFLTPVSLHAVAALIDHVVVLAGPAQFRALVGASWRSLVAARAGEPPPAASLGALEDGTAAVTNGEGREVAAQLTALLAAASVAHGGADGPRQLQQPSGGWRLDVRVVERACGEGAAGRRLAADVVAAAGHVVRDG